MSQNKKELFLRNSLISAAVFSFVLIANLGNAGKSGRELHLFEILFYVTLAGTIAGLLFYFGNREKSGDATEGKDAETPTMTWYQSPVVLIPVFGVIMYTLAQIIR